MMRHGESNSATCFAVAGAWAACLALFAMCLGCESVAGSKALTLVRVIDASSNAPATSVTVGSTAIAGNVGANTITNYAYLPPGQATATVYVSGTTKVLSEASGSFLNNQQHSILLTDAGTGIASTVLTDQSAGGPSGYVSVRFLQFAPNESSLDVYFIPDKADFTDYTPVASGLAPGTLGAYINIPVGSYDVVLVPTGGTKAVYTSPATDFSSGQVRTLLIVKSALSTAATPVSIVVGDDVN